MWTVQKRLSVQCRSPGVTEYAGLGDLNQAFDRPGGDASLEDFSDCDTHMGLGVIQKV